MMISVFNDQGKWACEWQSREGLIAIGTSVIDIDRGVTGNVAKWSFNFVVQDMASLLQGLPVL